MANNGRARKVLEQREPSRRQLRSTNGVRPLPEANASSQVRQTSPAAAAITHPLAPV